MGTSIPTTSIDRKLEREGIRPCPNPTHFLTEYRMRGLKVQSAWHRQANRMLFLKAAAASRVRPHQQSTSATTSADAFGHRESLNNCLPHSLAGYPPPPFRSPLQRRPAGLGPHPAAMQMKEACAVLGLPANATALQVKLAYKQKALENHPDRFPSHVKPDAEARFKHISEAYTCLKNGPQATYGYGGRSQYSNYSGSSSWVNRGRRVNVFVASAPFALLIAGTLALGFSRAARAYRKQQKESPSRNPFLP